MIPAPNARGTIDFAAVAHAADDAATELEAFVAGCATLATIVGSSALDAITWERMGEAAAAQSRRYREMQAHCCALSEAPSPMASLASYHDSHVDTARRVLATAGVVTEHAGAYIAAQARAEAERRGEKGTG